MLRFPPFYRLLLPLSLTFLLFVSGAMWASHYAHRGVFTVQSSDSVRPSVRRKPPMPIRLTATERQMKEAGFVDVQQLDPSLHVSLMYARPDNFCGVVLYTDLHRAFLHPLAAQSLVKAQSRLRQLRPDLRLKVYDAARPMHVQQRMWNKVKGTSKAKYVSNPAHGGGLHNYGMAVDITLCTLSGDTLDMGTPIDYLGTAAHIDREAQLVASGRISRQALQHRRLLRQVMREAGFTPLRTEWWHFNRVSRPTARRLYRPIP